MREAAIASRSNRAMISGCRQRSAWSSFSAKTSWLSTSSTRYTEPIAPSPIEVTTRYRPPMTVPVSTMSGPPLEVLHTRGALHRVIEHVARPIEIDRARGRELLGADEDAVRHARGGT